MNFYDHFIEAQCDLLQLSSTTTTQTFDEYRDICADKTRSGRSKAKTMQEDRLLVRASPADRRLTSTDLRASTVAAQTVWKWLVQQGRGGHPGDVAAVPRHQSPSNRDEVDTLVTWLRGGRVPRHQRPSNRDEVDTLVTWLQSPDTRVPQTGTRWTPWWRGCSPPTPASLKQGRGGHPGDVAAVPRHQSPSNRDEVDTLVTWLQSPDTSVPQTGTRWTPWWRGCSPPTPASSGIWRGHTIKTEQRSSPILNFAAVCIPRCVEDRPVLLVPCCMQSQFRMLSFSKRQPRTIWLDGGTKSSSYIWPLSMTGSRYGHCVTVLLHKQEATTKITFVKPPSKFWRTGSCVVWKPSTWSSCSTSCSPAWCTTMNVDSLMWPTTVSDCFTVTVLSKGGHRQSSHCESSRLRC